MIPVSSKISKRTQTLQLLASYGVALPPQTKLPDDVLEKRLKFAINASQWLSTAIPNPPLDAASLKRWEDDPNSEDPIDDLCWAFRRDTVEEYLADQAAQKEGREAAKDLFVDPLFDLRDLILGVVQRHAQGWGACNVMDMDQTEWSINMRVS